MGNPNMQKGLPSVNPMGRARWKPLTDALRVELTADPKRARRIARRVLQMAEEGDIQAINFIADRTEGKAVQSIELGEPGSFMATDERERRITELQSLVLGDIKHRAEDAVEVPLLPTGVKK